MLVYFNKIMKEKKLFFFFSNPKFSVISFKSTQSVPNVTVGWESFDYLVRFSINREQNWVDFRKENYDGRVISRVV